LQQQHICNEIDLAFDNLAQGLEHNCDVRYLYIQLHPAWVLPIENERIRIRVRTPLDHQFVMHCYANESFIRNYSTPDNDKLPGTFRDDSLYGLLGDDELDGGAGSLDVVDY
jgi:hypothetical protein